MRLDSRILYTYLRGRALVVLFPVLRAREYLTRKGLFSTFQQKTATRFDQD